MLVKGATDKECYDEYKIDIHHTIINVKLFKKFNHRIYLTSHFLQTLQTTWMIKGLPMLVAIMLYPGSISGENFWSFFWKWVLAIKGNRGLFVHRQVDIAAGDMPGNITISKLTKIEYYICNHYWTSHLGHCGSSFPINNHDAKQKDKIDAIS